MRSRASRRESDPFPASPAGDNGGTGSALSRSTGRGFAWYNFPYPDGAGGGRSAPRPTRGRRRLVICADGGGSDDHRLRLWKLGLACLADEIAIPIHVCHFPPGTSKWNKVEHRRFAHITQNWRGRPLVSHEVIVNLIAHTATQQGLLIQAELDSGMYPTGLKVSNQELALVN